MSNVTSGLRILRRSPGFATTAVLTLALGIGVNVAIFSCVRAVLIDDLPYADPSRLVSLWQTMPRVRPGNFSVDDFEAIRQGAPAFSSVSGGAWSQVTVRGTADPERVIANRVTREFFAVFGVAPLQGRVFGAADFAPDVHPVVISHGVWRSQFGGATDAVGQTIHIDRDPWIVVGVMPSTFTPSIAGNGLWTPLAPAGARSPTVSLFLSARLAPGVTLQTARAQLGAIMTPRQRERRGYDGTSVERLGESDANTVRPGLLLLQGVAGFLLLITCANLANVFLAHTTARRRELGMRAALGAGRWRLVRQLLTEAAAVATLGGAIGVGAAYLGVPALIATASSVLPRGTTVEVRAPELVVGLGLGWLTALVFAAIPAYLASKADPLDAIRGATQVTAGRAIRALRAGLITAQVVLAVVVLTGAGLLIKSFARVVSLPMGFDARGLVTADLALPAPPVFSVDDARTFEHRLEDEVRARLGTRPVAFANYMPYGVVASRDWTLEPVAGSADERTGYADYRAVSAGYFATLGVPLIRGRQFLPADGAAGPPVAIVNEAFVKKNARRADPIGLQVRAGTSVFTIVGIVGDIRTGLLESSPNPAVYVPLEQTPSYALAIAVRASDTAAVAKQLAAAVRSLDPDVPLTRVGAIDAKVAEREVQRRFYLSMLSLFALLAGVLAAVGTYGVTAHVTGLRTRELGIRLALGARPGALKALVIGQGLRPVLAGVVGGVVGAWWVTSLLKTNEIFSSQLYEVTPHDPWTLAAAAVGLLATAAMACWIPARRASRVEPTVALRAE
jgi:putative ABC transport system permease protein